MSIDRQSRKVEDLLERGLTQYGEVAPRAGLEDRVLTNLRLESERVALPFWQRWSFRLGAIILSAALALVIVWRPNTRAPEAPHALVRIEPEAPRVSVPPPGPSNSRREPPLKARRRITPLVAIRQEPEQFPSTRPLSSQEQLLLAYVNQARSEEVADTARRVRSIEEVHVQDLEVAPLDIDRTGTATEQKQ